jgi:hypothetical protein
VFAEAFGKDPDFFAFYRSMQAYESSLRGANTRLVLSPSSQFFQYFNDAMGRQTGANPSPPRPVEPEAPESAPEASLSPRPLASEESPLPQMEGQPRPVYPETESQLVTPLQPDVSNGEPASSPLPQ